MMISMAQGPDLNASLGQLEKTLDLYLGQKAPQLPKNVREIIVNLAPWLTLIGIVVSLPLVLLALGLGALATPFMFLAGPAAGVSYGVSYTVSMVILAVALVLEAMAIPGLFKKSRKAWKLVYWAVLVSLVSNLFSFNIVSGLVGALISLYFLFQIKEYYK